MCSLLFKFLSLYASVVGEMQLDRVLELFVDPDNVGHLESQWFDFTILHQNIVF
jgi:hypothetical protein